MPIIIKFPSIFLLNLIHLQHSCKYCITAVVKWSHSVECVLCTTRDETMNTFFLWKYMLTTCPQIIGMIKTLGIVLQIKLTDQKFELVKPVYPDEQECIRAVKLFPT